LIIETTYSSLARRRNDSTPNEPHNEGYSRHGHWRRNFVALSLPPMNASPPTCGRAHDPVARRRQISTHVFGVVGLDAEQARKRSTGDVQTV
jgi:hypothetical protein